MNNITIILLFTGITSFLFAELLISFAMPAIHILFLKSSQTVNLIAHNHFSTCHSICAMQTTIGTQAEGNCMFIKEKFKHPISTVIIGDISRLNRGVE